MITMGENFTENLWSNILFCCEEELMRKMNNSGIGNVKMQKMEERLKSDMLKAQAAMGMRKKRPVRLTRPPSPSV